MIVYGIAQFAKRIGRTRRRRRLGVSDNDRKYYSIELAKEVLGYDPIDNSADYHADGTPKEHLAE